VADPAWRDPLDPSYAERHGGRWNAPDSHAALYLNADVATARRRIDRMLAGSPVRLEDLDDGAYVLVAATLPRAQVCADALTRRGLKAMALPATYPVGSDGEVVGHAACQRAGARVRAAGLRGVWCISASSREGDGRELAWFPATRRSVARPVWPAPLPLGQWRDASGWPDLGFAEQSDPVPAPSR
jgi:hypothetical protein